MVLFLLGSLVESSSKMVLSLFDGFGRVKDDFLCWLV
jgi:hypothetical protein